MTDQGSTWVSMDADGELDIVDSTVLDMRALLSGIAQVDRTSFVPRLNEEFDAFESEVEATLAEILAGEWDHCKDAIPLLCRDFATTLERWKNRSEREKYATALKVEVLTPLMIQEVKYLERSNAGANVLFETCAALLNGEKPRKPHTDDELNLIQETKEKLLALGVGPDFRPSFDKWFVIPGEAQDIVRWAKLSDAEMDSILAKKAEQIAELIATSAR